MHKRLTKIKKIVVENNVTVKNEKKMKMSNLILARTCLSKKFKFFAPLKDII